MSRDPALIPFSFGPESRPLNVQPPLSRYSFFQVISGRPSCGKTTCLLNLICRSKFYAGQFDTVFLVSPSFCSLGSADEIFAGIPESQRYTELTQDTLDSITRQIKDDCQGQRVLIVLDDVVNDVQRSACNADLQRLCFNRRHVTSMDNNAPPGGFCSIIATTQVLNRLPLALRKMASSVWLFPTRSPKERACIYDELCPADKKSFEKIIGQAWTSRYTPLICDVDAGLFYRIDPSTQQFQLIKSDDEWEPNETENEDELERASRQSLEAARRFRRV